MEGAMTLNTGARMPILGLGTWKSEPSEVGAAVTYALTKIGYRHIDCAWIYRNEPEIGQAFATVFSSGAVRREDVFITGKLWNCFHARGNVAAACKESLRDLKLDYLDLYLIHWGVAIPKGHESLDEHGMLLTEKIPVRETWEAMEELLKEGFVRAIGVSNFTTPMLLDLLSYAKIAPAVNQVELHPYLQQSKLVEFCSRENIAVTAYSPLGRPGEAPSRLIDDPAIMRIAHAHQKTSAQILIRWAMQRGVAVIPKSTRPPRIKENSEVFDFGLTDAEMKSIAELDRGLRFVEPYEWWKIPYFN